MIPVNFPAGSLRAERRRAGAPFTHGSEASDSDAYLANNSRNPPRSTAFAPNGAATGVPAFVGMLRCPGILVRPESVFIVCGAGILPAGFKPVWCRPMAHGNCRRDARTTNGTPPTYDAILPLPDKSGRGRGQCLRAGGKFYGSVIFLKVNGTCSVFCPVITVMIKRVGLPIVELLLKNVKLY